MKNRDDVKQAIYTLGGGWILNFVFMFINRLGEGLSGDELAWRFLAVVIAISIVVYTMRLGLNGIKDA